MLGLHSNRKAPTAPISRPMSRADTTCIAAFIRSDGNKPEGLYGATILAATLYRAQAADAVLKPHQGGRASEVREGKGNRRDASSPCARGGVQVLPTPVLLSNPLADRTTLKESWGLLQHQRPA